MKFIELHSLDGVKRIVNLNHIRMIIDRDENTIIYYADSDFETVQESYNEIKFAIKHGKWGVR